MDQELKRRTEDILNDPYRSPGDADYRLVHLIADLYFEVNRLELDLLPRCHEQLATNGHVLDTCEAHENHAGYHVGRHYKWIEINNVQTKDSRQ